MQEVNIAILLMTDGFVPVVFSLVVLGARYIATCGLLLGNVWRYVPTRDVVFGMCGGIPLQRLTPLSRATLPFQMAFSWFISMRVY